ncbi:MAG: hypothetical protein V1487_03025 [bacterium]
MKQYTDQLDKVLSEYLIKKVPALPTEIKDLLVKLAPFFAILSVILGLPAILAVFGLGAFMTPFAWVVGARTATFWLFWLVSLVQIGFAGLSIKPLFARAGHGWRLMYYSQLVSIVTSLNHFNVMSLAFTLLSLYLLYQVKSSYK